MQNKRDIQRELIMAADLANQAKLGILSSCLLRASDLADGGTDPAQMTIHERLEQCIEFCGIAEGGGTDKAREAAPQIYQHIRAAQAFIA